MFERVPQCDFDHLAGAPERVYGDAYHYRSRRGRAAAPPGARKPSPQINSLTVTMVWSYLTWFGFASVIGGCQLFLGCEHLGADCRDQDKTAAEERG